METSKNPISKLRAVRILAGKPLHIIAEGAGISVPHLSRIERGIRGTSPEVIERLAGQLGVAAGSLFVGGDK
jgi:transcriptional regulator with XRE-family HTH domain